MSFKENLINGARVAKAGFRAAQETYQGVRKFGKEVEQSEGARLVRENLASLVTQFANHAVRGLNAFGDCTADMLEARMKKNKNYTSNPERRQFLKLSSQAAVGFVLFQTVGKIFEPQSGNAQVVNLGKGSLLDLPQDPIEAEGFNLVQDLDNLLHLESGNVKGLAEIQARMPNGLEVHHDMNEGLPGDALPRHFTDIIENAQSGLSDISLGALARVEEEKNPPKFALANTKTIGGKAIIKYKNLPNLGNPWKDVPVTADEFRQILDVMIPALRNMNAEFGYTISDSQARQAVVQAAVRIRENGEVELDFEALRAVLNAQMFIGNNTVAYFGQDGRPIAVAKVNPASLAYKIPANTSNSPENTNRFEGDPNIIIMPVKGYVTSGFGWRWGRRHNGIDIAAKEGTPIVSPVHGKIVGGYGFRNKDKPCVRSSGIGKRGSDCGGGYGNYLIVEGPDGTYLFGHMFKIAEDIQVGTIVEAGKEIGRVGSTGNSSGPHVHLEVRDEKNNLVNPQVRFTSAVVGRNVEQGEVVRGSRTAGKSK